MAELARREKQRRPFRHLPKQFSKGILIGNIAIVPKKYTGTRYVYVIADMMEAKILYEQVSLKQSAIIIAHHIAEHKPAPQEVIDFDTHFTSKLFEIQSSKAMIKAAEKERNDVQPEIYDSAFIGAVPEDSTLLNSGEVCVDHGEIVEVCKPLTVDGS